MTKTRAIIKAFLWNQKVIPFETMFAFFCVWSGIAGLVHFGIANDIFAATVGVTMAAIFNGGYILAGLAMYFGVGMNRKDIEAFGLISVATSVVVRQLVIATTVGLDPIIFNGYIFATAFLTACGVRLHSIIKRRSTPLLIKDRRLLSTVVLADKRGNIVQWDENAKFLFGYRKDEVLGEPLTMLMPLRYRNAHTRALMGLAKGNPQRLMNVPIQVEAQHRDGYEFPILLTINSWTLGDTEYYSGTISKR